MEREAGTTQSQYRFSRETEDGATSRAGDGAGGMLFGRVWIAVVEGPRSVYKNKSKH